MNNKIAGFMHEWGRDSPLKTLINLEFTFQRCFPWTVVEPLVHKTGTIIIDSETRSTELIDNVYNFKIP